MRHPPENTRTPRSMASSENPRPDKIFRTSDSRPSASMASSSSVTAARRFLVVSISVASISNSPRSTFPNFSISSASSVISLITSVSADRTSSTTRRSDAFTSCSTSKTSQFRGTGNFRAARCRSKVVFPFPLGPISPYLCPYTSFRLVFTKRSCPGADSEKPSQTTASPAGGGSRSPPGTTMLKVVSISPVTNSSFPPAFASASSFSKCLSHIFFSALLSDARPSFSTFALMASSLDFSSFALLEPFLVVVMAAISSSSTFWKGSARKSGFKKIKGRANPLITQVRFFCGLHLTSGRSGPVVTGACMFLVTACQPAFVLSNSVICRSSGP
mmetsp:Transcript_64763/g.173505  ORF Transcript_64763/g.173505 Transcript_64763/m.173505 type:complete len:331 (-) Transcript_64763:688-1680(-)